MSRRRAERGAAVAVAATLAALAMLAVPAPAPAATVPHGMFAMQDWRPPTAAMMTPVAAAGVERWRAPIFWDKVEPTRGLYDWTRYDQVVGDSARSHMPLLAIIVGCPRWACADGIGPPATPQTLVAQRAFVTAAVLRYGSHGSFWAAHPELTPQPVTEWQVWNEVNHPEYFKPAPSAAGYASFLRDEALAIRLADRAATVVLSGLSDVPPANAATFLSQLYAQPGFKSSFDVMAVHAYASDTRGVADLLDRVRQVEVQNGEGLRRMWMTEIGWGTASAHLWTPTTEAQQATRMRQSFDMAIGCRTRWNLDRAYWFAYNDITPAAAGVRDDNAGFHTGLFDTAGRAKPAWSTLLGYRAGAALPGGRGDRCVIPAHEPVAAAAAPVTAAAAAPVATFGASSAGSFRAVAPQTWIFARRRLRNTRRAKLAFASSTGARFECRLLRGRASRRWRRCGSRYRSARLRRGRYRLQVRAVDPGGATDPRPAVAGLRRKGRQVLITVRTR